MIDLVNLEKSYGDRTLFTEVSLKLQAGSRYGLVGANGSGKSTLLAILARQDSPTSGEVAIPGSVRVGLLEQDRFLSDSQRIIDVAMMGDREVWDDLREQERLVLRGTSTEASEEHFEAASHAQSIADLEERIRARDGYTLKARSGAVLEGLGIAAGRHDLALSSLSGGFKLRVLLAQTLVGRPDLLLLDEPTNHLDILTIRWLEKFLAAYAGCAVVISHDHRFLDNIATHILDVDYETVTLYHGNYRRFVEEKAATSERMEAQAERQQHVIDEKKAFIERFRSKATKARQAQSRAKQVERLERDLTAPPTLAALPFRAAATERPRRADGEVREQVLRRKTRADRRLTGDPPGRESGRDRRQRPWKIDALEDRDGTPCRGHGRNELGLRSASRILRARSRGALRRSVDHGARLPLADLCIGSDELRSRAARPHAV